MKTNSNFRSWLFILSLHFEDRTIEGWCGVMQCSIRRRYLLKVSLGSSGEEVVAVVAEGICGFHHERKEVVPVIEGICGLHQE